MSRESPGEPALPEVGVSHGAASVSGQRVERIGDAVLYLGDALEVLPSLGPVDMVFTDPPYGHNNNDGDLIHQREAALGRLRSGDNPPVGRPIANDGPEANEIFRKALPMLEKLLREGSCCCCCCGGGGPDPQFARWALWVDEVFDFKQMVIWDKGPMGMGWHYRRSYETVLVGQKRGGPCRWFDTSRKVENIIRPGDYGIAKIIPGKDNHPTEKPVALSSHFIRLHSAPGDIVLDPFMGSGSTGISCLDHGRSFVGIEVDEEQFEIAVRRIRDAYAQPRLPLEEPPQATPQELPL